jgi:hypothetical protein
MCNSEGVTATGLNVNSAMPTPNSSGCVPAYGVGWSESELGRSPVAGSGSTALLSIDACRLDGPPSGVAECCVSSKGQSIGGRERERVKTKRKLRVGLSKLAHNRWRREKHTRRLSTGYRAYGLVVKRREKLD